MGGTCKVFAVADREVEVGHHHGCGCVLFWERLVWKRVIISLVVSWR